MPIENPRVLIEDLNKRFGKKRMVTTAGIADWF
ncbi:MAG: hypothetical protein CM1200mP20_13600 [Pseudomonadota bacterium]|nr:MAG: hypothetical protein CM1200mP20_13600 [Pseudomonadota bacterium]